MDIKKVGVVGCGVMGSGIVRMLESGDATKEDIDTGIRLGLNHAMGSIQTADLIGLDTVYHIAKAMYDEFKAPRFSPPVLLRKMVVAGRAGRRARASTTTPSRVSWIY